MNFLNSALMVTMFFSIAAGAVDLPTSNAPDFSQWASNTLQKEGITGAQVVETKYPFSFTYCSKDSLTLWRYDVMSAEQIVALKEGRIVKPVTEKRVAVERNSESCKAAS